MIASNGTRALTSMRWTISERTERFTPAGTTRSITLAFELCTRYRASVIEMECSALGIRPTKQQAAHCPPYGRRLVEAAALPDRRSSLYPAFHCAAAGTRKVRRRRARHAATSGGRTRRVRALAPQGAPTSDYPCRSRSHATTRATAIGGNARIANMTRPSGSSDNELPLVSSIAIG